MFANLTVREQEQQKRRKLTGRSSNGSETEERDVLPNFLVPSSNLSKTIEPETGVTAETTAQEFIEGQQSNAHNRLHNNYEFWEKDLQSTSFVLDIDSGYRLPFKDTTPSKCFLKNNKSALKNSDFVKKAIKQLLSEGKIEECASAPFCENPLSVVEGKKKRLVLDLRHVDKFQFIPKFITKIFLVCPRCLQKKIGFSTGT